MRSPIHRSMGDPSTGSVEMYVALQHPSDRVCASLRSLVRAIERRDPPYERLLFRLSCSNPDGSVKEYLDRGCCVELQAAAQERFFPRFLGTLTVVPTNEACALWMEGRYEVPFGRVGVLLDTTVLRGVAKNRLAAFVQWFTGRINAIILEQP